jgi:predicted nucleic acid-binding protein
MVVAEAVYLLTRELGGHAESAFYDALVDGTLTVEPLTSPDWQRIRQLVERYAKLPLGGTDASLIAIAERLGATRIATLDRAHFHIIRPAHCDAFELAPTP